MEWGTIIFAVLGLAFLVLIILAIRQMRAPVVDSEEEEEEDLELEESAEEGAEEGPEEEEERALEEEEAGKAVEDDRPTTEPVEERRAEPEPGLEEGPEPEKAKKPGKERKAPDPEEEKRRLKKGLAKTRGGFIAKLGSLFKGKRELSAEMVDQVEEILFTADIGVRTSQDLIDNIRKELGKKELGSPEAIWSHIKDRSSRILKLEGTGAVQVQENKPFVILVIGVNGTGKTTTIGKLAARFKDEGHSVLLAAADTFRAAAVEQLAIWAERAAAEVVQGKEGADPSSVIVEALKKAKTSDVDVVIADTAGRLHTKVDLMEELQKVRRSINKWVEGAPHETLLVLDATTGQNAIAQARMFKEAMEISGIILTKLDGTAKGGVVLGICHELGVPVRYIGIGEKLEDLRVFEPSAFVEALYEGADSEAQGG
jgi:fused signal recognition particle receptor